MGLLSANIVYMQMVFSLLIIVNNDIKCKEKVDSENPSVMGSNPISDSDFFRVYFLLTFNIIVVFVVVLSLSYLIIVILPSSVHKNVTAKRLGRIDSLKQIALKINK